MKNNNNKPKLRFPGFTEPWEQRKLGEVCRINGRIGFRGYTQKDIISKEEGGVLTFSPTNIVDNRLTLNVKNTYITRVKYEESPEIMIFDGDILFVKTGSTLGKSALVTGLEENASINPQIIVMRTEHEMKRLLSVILTSETIQAQVAAYKIGGAIPTLTETKIKEFEFYMPVNKKEKLQIGAFFKQLDNLITLHQRKLNHLQDKKKSLLQKMFPKNGEDFPELRFPGFTDAWEQRKLKQLANFAKGQGYSKNDLTDEGKPIILYGRLYTKYQSTISEVDTFAVPKSGSVYSTGEEVIVPASGETAEDIARASAVVKSGFLLGGDLNIIYPNKDINTVFLALSISNGKQQKELSKKAQGKSVVHLHNSDLEDVTISFPCRDEQAKIGSVFEQLDNLITLHQRKLDHLKEQKKALLQQMFI